jgi:hypothetical protein
MELPTTQAVVEHPPANIPQPESQDSTTTEAESTSSPSTWKAPGFLRWSLGSCKVSTDLGWRGGPWAAARSVLTVVGEVVLGQLQGQY